MLLRVLGPIASLLVVACRGAESPDDPAMKMTGSHGTTDVPMDTTTTGGPDVPGDRCDEPRAVEPGRRYGSLAGAQPDGAGNCGFDGPIVFLQLEIDRRADLRVSAQGEGFVPIVAVQQSCHDDAELACAQGLPITVLDLPRGSAPIVAVGISPKDPALAAGQGELDFAIDLELRTVLATGDTCTPTARGRCEIGSACLPDDDGIARCIALDGDTCATAEPHVFVAAMPIVIDIDPNALQTDAHAHSCTGARRSERVLRLELPDDLALDSALRVSTEATDVGLAVRGATCLSDDELGCAAPRDGGVALEVAELPARLGSDRAVYVFVELPIDAAEIDPTAMQGELAPFSVAIEVDSGL